MTTKNGGTASVIGSGPSGLAAACALKRAGVNVTIYDSGKHLANRQHERANDLAVGVGGAGLFSDGKFSFYPSGTHVYGLADSDQLKEAYEWCRKQLQDVDIDSEPFPLGNSDTGLQVKTLEGLKKYPSHYATLPQRKALIAHLHRELNGSLVTESTVTAVRRTYDGYSLDVIPNGQSNSSINQASIVILASGRFGGLDIHEGRLESNILLRQLRYEFGIRIESHCSVGFLSKLKLPDVKRLWQYDQAQIRTFCTCRDGEIWNIPCAGLSALSGRSDGPPTQYSNFGLLARFEGELVAHGYQLWKHLRGHSLQDRTVTYEPLSSFINQAAGTPTGGFDHSYRPWFPKEDFKLGSIREKVGEPLYNILVAAVKDLLDWSSDLYDERTMCLFPAVEGVGFYPDIDDNLKVSGENIWCCGDIAGKFRGLIPSIVSGYYAGLMAAEALTTGLKPSEEADRMKAAEPLERVLVG